MAHIYITPKAQLIYSYILLTIFRKLLLLNTIFVKHHIWPTCVRRCSSFFLISFFHRQTFPPSDSAHVTSHLRNVLRTYLVLCYPQVVAGYSPPSHNNNTALCLEPQLIEIWSGNLILAKVFVLSFCSRLCKLVHGEDTVAPPRGGEGGRPPPQCFSECSFRFVQIR